MQDRAANFGRNDYHVASMAATGFGMAALVIGARRGYLPRAQAYRRLDRTLRFAAGMPHFHGWLYHFVDIRTGQRVWKCEVSTIDTALWAAGALAAGAYFRGTKVDRLARRLFDRIDFNVMRTDGGARPDELLLTMGWRPEEGYLRSRWRTYSEGPLLYLMALSSRTHPIPASCWTAWQRDEGRIGPYRALGIHLPLFVHQYLHCWTDLKGRTDSSGFDYWRNSAEATLANRWFCIHRAGGYPELGPHGWGLSACDGPDGYRGYAPDDHAVDGTLSPLAVAASCPFAPAECRSALDDMLRRHGDWIWGRYGFSSYDASKEWRGRDVVGIDEGAALLMLDAADHRDHLIARLLERAGLGRGLRRAGFKPRARRIAEVRGRHPAVETAARQGTRGPSGG